MDVICRKCNMNYWWSILASYLKKNTLGAELCFEMTRYLVVILYFLRIKAYVAGNPDAYLFSFYIRLKIFLGCIGYSLKLPRDWNQLPIYLNRFFGFLLSTYVRVFFFIPDYSINSTSTNSAFKSKELLWNDYLSFVDCVCSMMQHVTSEGTALVQQAEDAANNKVFWFVFLCLIKFLLTSNNVYVPYDFKDNGKKAHSSLCPLL